MIQLYKDSNGNTVEVDTSVSEYIHELRKKIDYAICSLRLISALKTKTLLGENGMTYSDGAHNAFCEASEIADYALKEIK